jgi:putative membrane protein
MKKLGRRPIPDTSGGIVIKKDRTRKETSADRLVYFAAERTLLSWVRAGLGLMALGFVVDRFGLILGQMKSHDLEHWRTDPFSSWIGISMILVGIACNVTAAIRYLRFEIRYHHEMDTRPRHGLSLGIFLTLIVSALGIVVVFLLIRTMK